MKNSDKKKSQSRGVRVVKFVIFNAAVAWLAWFAVIGGSVGAGRLLAFVLWFLAVVYLILIRNDEAVKRVVERGRAVPVKVLMLVDLSLAGFLVWHGWGWTAAAVMIGWISTEMIYQKGTELEEECDE